MMFSIFHVLIGYLNILFGKLSIEIFAHFLKIGLFVFLLLSCLSVLYIIHIHILIRYMTFKYFLPF